MSTPPSPPQPTELITQITLLPTGMTIDDPNAHAFALTIQWRGTPTPTGRGGYAITHGNNHLSKKGNWRYNPEPHLQRHYRWTNLNQALETARKTIDTITVNGHTWHQWQQHHQNTQP